MKKTFVATRDMTYATRRLKAGDEFQANRRDGRTLVAIGKAAELPAAIAKLTKPTAHVDELTETRLRYENVVGKRAFHGWDVAELERRIAEHDQPDAAADDES